MLITNRPDPSPSSHDRVYRGLRTRIMHGEIAPGQSLTLRGVGEEFGVSMTPAREAIRRLTAEGALTLSSSGRVSTPELGNERIEELAALRALIEVELASRALPRAHIALIDRLQSINGLIAEHIVRVSFKVKFVIAAVVSASAERVSIRTAVRISTALLAVRAGSLVERRESELIVHFLLFRIA